MTKDKPPHPYQPRCSLKLPTSPPTQHTWQHFLSCLILVIGNMGRSEKIGVRSQNTGVRRFYYELLSPDSLLLTSYQRLTFKTRHSLKPSVLS